MQSTAPMLDYAVIGGGFYGCCLGLFLRSLSDKVQVIEAEEALLSRASRVNQARIHTGFHYPRSALTAVKSMILHQRFAADFPEAVVDDFQMLYAIARRRSKVSAKRFHRMFRDLGAPIAPAAAPQAALFDAAEVEQVFSCHETAFDWSVLQRLMQDRIDAVGVGLSLGTSVQRIEPRADDVVLGLSDGTEITARYVFNVTYANLNQVLDLADLPVADLKFELAEIAMVEMPDELRSYGVTVMDGPFFSAMPYPAEGLYSLTHVRYTPHRGWVGSMPADVPGPDTPPETRSRHMILDARRYLPAIAGATYRRSLFDIKAVRVRNEADDGRPILYQRRPAGSRVISVLGGKIDNVYDLLDLVRTAEPEFAAAHDGHVFGRTG